MLNNFIVCVVCVCVLLLLFYRSYLYILDIIRYECLFVFCRERAGGEGMHSTTCTRRSEDSLCKLVLSSTLSTRDQIQVARLGGEAWW